MLLRNIAKLLLCSFSLILFVSSSWAEEAPFPPFPPPISPLLPLNPPVLPINPPILPVTPFPTSLEAPKHKISPQEWELMFKINELREKEGKRTEPSVPSFNQEGLSELVGPAARRSSAGVAKVHWKNQRVNDNDALLLNTFDLYGDELVSFGLLKTGKAVPQATAAWHQHVNGVTQMSARDAAFIVESAINHQNVAEASNISKEGDFVILR